MEWTVILSKFGRGEKRKKEDKYFFVCFTAFAIACLCYLLLVFLKQIKILPYKKPALSSDETSSRRYYSPSCL